MSEQISQYTTEIVVALIGILAVLAKSWLEGLKRKAEAYYGARTTAEQRKVLAALGKEAYSFTEAAYRGMAGPEKLTVAIDYLERKAAAIGIKITFEEARAVIEAAWLEDETRKKRLLAQ